MAQIHLIGTCHNDFNGPKRLEKALNAERPTILSVEASQRSLDFLTKQNEAYCQKVLQLYRKGGLNEQRIASEEEFLQSVSGYESEVCHAYTEKNGIPLHLIDAPCAVRLIKRIRAKELRKLKNLARSGSLYIDTDERHIRQCDMRYETIQRWFEGDYPAEEQRVVNAFRKEKGVFGERDRTMAEGLTTLIKKHPDAKVVHVGGLAHLLNDAHGKTLYARLKELQPTRTTLIYYDV